MWLTYPWSRTKSGQFYNLVHREINFYNNNKFNSQNVKIYNEMERREAQKGNGS